MSIAERYVGTCRGGPYDGQELVSEKSTYPIIVWCSTSCDPGVLALEAEMLRWQGSKYVFTDSTWVWHDK